MSVIFTHNIDANYVLDLASQLFASEVHERNKDLPPGKFIFHDHQVDRMCGYKFEIFSNEHPPPHFRVSKGGQVANFSIIDCVKLNGDKRFERDTEIIKSWHQRNRTNLIETWNRVRPSDCPVGPIKE